MIVVLSDVWLDSPKVGERERGREERRDVRVERRIKKMESERRKWCTMEVKERTRKA